MDALLDDPAFIDTLYAREPIEIAGQPVSRSAKPVTGWQVEDPQFGILDRSMRVFFCPFPVSSPDNGGGFARVSARN